MKKRQAKVELKKKALHLAVASVFTVTPAWAAPTNPTVTHGNASFSQSGSTLTVTNTPGSIINWASFGINAGETVKFVQQSAASAVLNRVTGMNPSQILGTLQSNGKVFLINPRGILFGQGAVIDTAGFVASTLNMTDEDFLNGRMRFNADIVNPGGISNAGEIKTPHGGFVYLIAPDVENTGIINTPSGEAILAAGHHVELVDSGDPDLRVTVSASTEDVNLSQMMQNSGGNIFSVLNSGRISANTAVAGAGGKIYFKSAGNIRTTASSVVEAKGDTTRDGGYIQGFAFGSGRYEGIFDISGRNGGFVETSGAMLDVAGISVIAGARDAAGHGGMWLLDPFNYFLDASQAASIVSTLEGGGNVTVDTAFSGPGNTGPGSGDITLAADIIANTAYGNDVSLTFLADGKFIGNGKIENTGSELLSVFIIADRNNDGNGGIELNQAININGNLKLTSKSGDIELNQAINIQGNLDLTANSGDIELNQAISILSNLALTSYGGDIVVKNDINAATNVNDTITVNTYGNVKILGGSGANESASLTAQAGSVDINFLSPGHQLILEGGAGSGNSASISAGIDSSSGVTIRGDEVANNPDVTIKSFSNSDAYIRGSKISIYADDLLVQGASASTAKLETIGASQVIDLTVNQDITLDKAQVTGDDGVYVSLISDNGKIALKNDSIVGTSSDPETSSKVLARIIQGSGNLTTDASSQFRADDVELKTYYGDIDVRAEALSKPLGIEASTNSNGNITLRALAPVFAIYMTGSSSSELVLIPEAGIGDGPSKQIIGQGKNMRISRPGGDLLFDDTNNDSFIKFNQLVPDGTLTISGRNLDFGNVSIEADGYSSPLVLAATDKITFFNSYDGTSGGAARFTNIGTLQAAATNSIAISDTDINNFDTISLISRDIRLTEYAFMQADYIGLSATRDLSLENVYVASYGGMVYLTGRTVTLDASYVSGEYVAVNYDPETLMAVTGIGDLSDLNSNRSSSVVTLNNSDISGSTAVGVKSASLTLNATDSYGGTTIYGGQFVDLMTTGNVTLNATAGNASIYGGNEVYMATGGQVILNSGLGSASIEAGLVTTIYMDFPLLTGNGYLVDGENSIVSSINPFTGFFASGMPAQLGENLFVRYGGASIDPGIQQSVDQIQRRTDETYECS